MSQPVEVNYWAEGPTDRAVARKLIAVAKGRPGADYAKRRGSHPGKDYLDSKLRAFNEAARHAPWLVLRDGDGECPVTLRRRLLPNASSGMVFRVVVPEIEVWLMADHLAFAKCLGVTPDLISPEPERIERAKAEVLRLAARSGKKAIKDDLMPRVGSGLRVGPGYVDTLLRFTEAEWSIERASLRSPSLKRAITRLESVVRRG